MTPLHIRRQFLESSRGRIVALLRRGRATIDEMSRTLELTDNAVRVQIAAMMRDGLVTRSGQRRGPTRPAALYELTPELEHLLSGAYLPLLTQLLHAVASSEPPDRVDELLRAAGRGLADVLPVHLPEGPLAARVAAASELLNRELGAVTEVERSNGTLVIRGHGCPLAALTGKHPSVCHAIQSLLVTLLDSPVDECCDRADQPRCCFSVPVEGGHSESRASPPR
ncbi:MAG TPA: hypothetical protein VEA99_01805 [Gemmatimonadaceae bacterium]|nr:hypothetical protein [Gemmatimonadaceae bacterium]